jgi:hypothetical protein
MARSRIVDITPDRSLLPKLGFAGYSAPQAVAELVDNAIDARRDGSRLHVAIQIGPQSIEVADDGMGMDRETLAKAMILAYSRKMGKLGEFGLGLKTACLSLGEAFEVRSSPGNRLEYRVSYDPETWMSAGRAWKVRLEESPARGRKSWTAVRIRRPKVFYPRLPTLIRLDLQRRFSPFIRGRELELRVNGRLAEVEETRLLPGSKKEFRLKTRKGATLAGWYGLLAEGSTKGYYGFHTYRRNRMISTFDKLGIGEDPRISRITGEIHLDHVPVTHNKREFIRESSEYREAVSLLTQEFRALVREAKRQASLDTVTASVEREVRSWQRKIAAAFDSAEFRRFALRFRRLATAMGGGGGGSNSSGGKAKGAPPRGRTAVEIRGRTIPFHHHYSPLGVSAGRRQSSFSRKLGLDIYTNTDFPAFAATRDKVFYAVLNVAETLAEFLVRESNEDPARTEEIKEVILRKSAELKLESR